MNKYILQQHMYCVKCRDHIKVDDLEIVTFKNKKRAYKGHCPKCGTATYKILKNE